MWEDTKLKENLMGLQIYICLLYGEKTEVIVETQIEIRVVLEISDILKLKTIDAWLYSYVSYAFYVS